MISSISTNIFLLTLRLLFFPGPPDHHMLGHPRNQYLQGSFLSSLTLYISLACLGSKMLYSGYFFKIIHLTAISTCMLT